MGIIEANQHYLDTSSPSFRHSGMVFPKQLRTHLRWWPWSPPKKDRHGLKNYDHFISDVCPRHLRVKLYVEEDHVAIYIAIGAIVAFIIHRDDLLGLRISSLVLFLESWCPLLTPNHSAEGSFTLFSWHLEHRVLLQDRQP